VRARADQDRPQPSHSGPTGQLRRSHDHENTQNRSAAKETPAPRPGLRPAAVAPSGQLWSLGGWTLVQRRVSP
jgi:hypothetical protein